MSRFRGLLPGVLLVVVLPLTLALIAIAIGATTLHQNEMRDLIALRDERAVREVAQSLAERVTHRQQLSEAVTELTRAGVPLAEAQQRLGLTAEADASTLQALDLPEFADQLRGTSELYVMLFDAAALDEGSFFIVCVTIGAALASVTAIVLDLSRADRKSVV